MPGNDIGVDLGTASILVYVKGKGIVLREPSVIAYDRNTDEVVAIGEAARKMLGRTPDNIEAVRPLRDGVISNFDFTAKMLKYFIRRVCGKFPFRPRIMICVPSLITEVEERAVYDSAMEAGARRVYLIEEPIAAAIGAGLEISQPRGSMIVDIGGGTTDVAVISLGSAVASTSIKVAGDEFDEAIIRYVRRRYSVLIGERTAEDIKINIGCVYPRDGELSMAVKGRSLISGLPMTIAVSSEEMREALAEVSQAILDAVHSVLERTPPELTGDILGSGILLTGGGSLIYGLAPLLSESTGIPVRVADDPITCVARGTGIALEHLEQLTDGLLYISRNKRDEE